MSQDQTESTELGMGPNVGEVAVGSSSSSSHSDELDHSEQDTSISSTEEDTTNNEASTTRVAKWTFLTIATDVRDLIYTILLVNNDIGTMESINGDRSNGASLSYHLYPNILRVCRQIYMEAKSILYERNIFYNLCLSSNDGLNRRYDSYNIPPLTRYIQSDDNGLYPSVADCPSYPLVGRWNVLCSTRSWDENELPLQSFLDFCRALFKSNAKKVSVKLVEKMFEEGSSREDYLSFSQAMGCATNLLRNLEFTLEDAMFDVPGHIRMDDGFVQLYSARENWSPEEEVELFESVTSNRPAECIMRMYAPLERYAQAFELFKPFKLEMAFEEDQEHCEEVKAEFVDYFDSNRGNPFRHEHMHRVEATLNRAKNASQLENSKDFKKERSILLNLLEPQFQRIEQVARHLNEVIKQAKQYQGFFDDDYGFSRRRQTNHVETEELRNVLVVLLEEYADSLKRELTLEMKLQVRPWKKFFNSLYDDLPIFVNYRKAFEAHDCCNIELFFRYFRLAVTGFDEVYLEIHEARQALLRFDFLDSPGLDIEIHANFVSGAVDWNVTEPDYDVPEDDSHHDDNQSDGTESEAGSENGGDSDHDSDSYSHDGENSNEDEDRQDNNQGDDPEHEDIGSEDEENAGSDDDPQSRDSLPERT